MKQVVQDQGEGRVFVLDVPEPLLQAPGILVQTAYSIISSGTERAKMEMGEKGLLAKARARPDLAKKVLDQARADGIRATRELVRDRLGSPQPLGYSAAGVIRRVGNGASGFEPGQPVAIAGAGYANHAEINYVPATLAAPVPHGVALEDAAFATLASIALHGIRQAGLTQGELVVVSGLGLIGQLSVRLLRAYGHPVVGIDPSAVARQEVAASGVEVRSPDDPSLLRLGADAVLLTAATSSDGPIRDAPGWCRDRGRVVIVGDVGLALTRPPYYDREVDLRFSRSYGPGRYDPKYEEQGHDYPVGYVRWTEGRNLAEFLRLLQDRRIEVSDLVDARFPAAEAPLAYERLAHGARVRALLLDYPKARTVQLPGNVGVRASSPARRDGQQAGRLRMSVCGAGNFARKTLIPAFDQTSAVEWAYISTASGLTAAHVASQRGFKGAVDTGAEALLADQVDAGLIASRHDSHAQLASIAAARGLPTYVEKPLAVNAAELDDLDAIAGRGALTTGFNRRMAGAVTAAMPALRSRREPGTVHIRVNAGRLPKGHWADAPEHGGRIVGELCHFVDLACHLLGVGVTSVAATGSGLREPQVEDTLQVLLRHSDHSLSCISYVANGSPALPKEHVEAHWDGRSLVIHDFRSWELDDGGGLKTRRLRKQDKGHAALVAAFVKFAGGLAPNPVPFEQASHVTRITFCIVDALAEGTWQQVPPSTW